MRTVYRPTATRATVVVLVNEHPAPVVGRAGALLTMLTGLR